MVKIDQADWDALQQLMRSRDGTALALGVARAEYLEKRGALYVEDPRPTDFMLRLGAMQHEYLQHEANLERSIGASRRAQAALGEKALRSAGLDPDAAEYTIVDGGQVLRLIGGAWWEEWDAQAQGVKRSAHGSQPIGGA